MKIADKDQSLENSQRRGLLGFQEERWTITSTGMGEVRQDDPRPVHSASGSTRNEDLLWISQAVRTDSVQACSLHI